MKNNIPDTCMELPDMRPRGDFIDLNKPYYYWSNNRKELTQIVCELYFESGELFDHGMSFSYSEFLRDPKKFKKKAKNGLTGRTTSIECTNKEFQEMIDKFNHDKEFKDKINELVNE